MTRRASNPMESSTQIVVLATRSSVLLESQPSDVVLQLLMTYNTFQLFEDSKQIDQIKRLIERRD